MLRTTHHFNVLNDTQNARILCDATNANAMRILAVDVLDYDICRVPLESEAVIPGNDMSIPQDKIGSPIGTRNKHS